jgi:AmmeMemoRadiSam system protein B
MNTIPNARPSPIAGLWYEGDPQALRLKVEGFLANASLPELKGEVIALIAPHAGHRYSGATAGYAFRCVQGLAFDHVVVLSPYHDYHPAPLLTSGHPAYQTPLGEVSVDQDIVTRINAFLHAQTGSGLVPVSSDREHALEIQLPFLQLALSGSFSLVPLMLRTFDPDLLYALGSAVSEALKGSRAILVASTDLSHQYSASQAYQLDAEMLNAIASLSPEKVLETELSGRGFACGAPAVAAALWAAVQMGADTAHILHHSTSGDVTGDMHAVVGYGAAVVLRSV